MIKVNIDNPIPLQGNHLRAGVEWLQVTKAEFNGFMSHNKDIESTIHSTCEPRMCFYKTIRGGLDIAKIVMYDYWFDDDDNIIAPMIIYGWYQYFIRKECLQNYRGRYVNFRSRT